MAENFNLNWRMTIEFPDGRSDTLKLGYPLTCEFNIKKFGSAVNTTAEFKIYNLSQSTREVLFQDYFDSTYDKTLLPMVTFECGYGDKLVVVFKSQLWICTSQKQSGSADIITTLTCFNTSCFDTPYTTYAKGTSKKEVIKDLINKAGYEVGTISDIEGVLDRDYPVTTSYDTAIREIAGNSVTYDNNTISVLMPLECMDTSIFSFGSYNIYGSPKRDGVFVTFSTKLFPEIVYNQLIKLESQVQPEYNGEMKVFGLEHVGTISGAVPCSAQTNVSCLYTTPHRANVPQNITAGVVIDSKTGAENNNAKAYQTWVIVDKDGKPIDRSVTEEQSLRAVWQDIQKNGKNAKSLNKKAYRNIKWSDLIQSNNFNYGELPTLQHITNAYTMIKLVYSTLQSVVGNRVVIVNSCWRNSGNNASVGGVSNSKHLQGLAIDFRLSTTALTHQYANAIMKSWKRGWSGYYPNQHFIHVQLDSNRIDSK